jgi:hypothetical protein
MKAHYFIICLSFLLTGCESKWVGPNPEPGPLPLSSTNVPITRLVKSMATFEVTLRETYWDEGNGPVSVRDRIRPVAHAIPRELLDRLNSRTNVDGQEGNNGGVYLGWGVVVSVNPDVLVVSVREQPKGSDDYAFEEWSIASNAARQDYIFQRLENFNYIAPSVPIPFSAGTLVPWSDEIYVVSTDPNVKYGRLKFENNQATVLLPDGKLVFRHNDDDVDVSRE